MRIDALCLFVFLAMIGAACASESGVRAPGGAPLVVASDLDNPPFAEVDENGREHGRDVEMMERIASALKRPIEWRRMPFAELIPAVERGEVDIVCATLGITPGRARRVAFSVPYFETELTAVARSGAGEPRSIEDLDGRKVAAGTGTTSERAVLLRLPRATGVFENKSQMPLHERLVSGEVDAAVLDGPNADDLIAKSNGALTRLAGDLGDESYALALPKSKPELLAEINRELLRMEERGDLRRLDAEYALRQRASGRTTPATSK
jgi:polar amino acid transport system substrate-binding protein